MARQNHTAQAAPGKWPAAGAVVTFLAADVTNKEQFTLTGRELLLAKNTGGSPFTVTINSVNDPYNRTKDITAESVAAGAERMFGPLDVVGWKQTDGRLYFEASNVAIQFAVISLPAL